MRSPRTSFMLPTTLTQAALASVIVLCTSQTYAAPPKAAPPAASSGKALPSPPNATTPTTSAPTTSAATSARPVAGTSSASPGASPSDALAPLGKSPWAETPGQGEKPKAADAKSGAAKSDTDEKDKDGKIVFDNVSNDVTELRDRTYVYLGLRYRGTILPKFLLNAFVREGATVYQNSIGLEADFRTNNFSIIPSLTYMEFGLGDTLFLEKNKDENFAGNWSNVNSTLKGVFVGADFLWSAKLSRTLDFEYGIGVGVGVLFGDLEASWVYQNANGPWVSSDGTKRFSPCITEADGVGCRKIEHSNAAVAKVNRYKEPNWFNGGYLPAFLPQLSIPSLGLRFKPHPRFQARLGLGMSLSGFWFGLSANYGVTAPKKAAAETEESVEKEETTP